MDQSYYNTVSSITFSPCGNYFVAGNVFGDLVLFNLNNIVNNTDSSAENLQIAKCKFNLNAEQKSQICCATSSDQFLIVGSTGEIIGWNWDEITNLQNGNTPKSAWKIHIPTSTNGDTTAEVNSVKTGTKTDVAGDVLYAGCGDNNVYSFSLEDGRLLTTYSGHTDYIHNIDLRDNLIASGSEDGSVRLWDCRTAEVTNIIEPHRRAEIERPELGNWIGDVSLSDNWLVCGGGSRLSLWNLRTTDCPMTIFTSTRDQGIHVAKFHQDSILAGGSAPHFSLLNFNDELRTGMQSSNSTVYSCALSVLQNSPKALSFVGNGNNIDITTNFRYREYVIPFY